MTKLEKEIKRREQRRIDSLNKVEADLAEDAMKVLWDVVLVLIGIVLGVCLTESRVQAATSVSIPPRCEYVGVIPETPQTGVEPPTAVNEVQVATMPDAQMVEPVGERWESLGVFRCTAYCGCRRCNGKWTGQPTASGVALQPGVTIAVDKRLIPFFTILKIDGIGVRVAHDTGKNIYGKRIDVYIPDHKTASRFGIQYHEVFIRKGETE